MLVAPGIERIESILGPRPFAQYLLHDERALLVDTGTAATPHDVILPFLAAHGLPPERLDWVCVTHADVDHCGGNLAMRAAAPRAIFCAHHADAPWIEDHDCIFRERYGWYAAEDVDYDAATYAWLHAALPATMPLDLRLTGGERFRLGRRLTVDVLHLPGHSPGHIGLWEASSRTAIIMDAANADGRRRLADALPPTTWLPRLWRLSAPHLQGRRTTKYVVRRGKGTGEADGTGDCGAATSARRAQPLAATRPDGADRGATRGRGRAR